MVASLYTQRVESLDLLRSVQYSDQLRLHDPAGSVLQLVGLQIAPSEPGALRLGDILVEHVLRWAALEDYIQMVAVIVPQRDDNDAGILFHTMRGAHMEGFVQKYRPNDKEKDGTGVLLVYSNPGGEAFSASRSSLHQSRPPNANMTSEVVRDLLLSAIESVVGEARSPRFEPQKSFMEMGIESAETSQIRIQIRSLLQIDISETAFFNYPTLDALTRHVSAAEESSTNSERSFPSTRYIGPSRIGIVGMSYMLPKGIDSASKLRQVTQSNQTVVQTIPPERWKLTDWCSSNGDLPGKAKTTKCGFLPKSVLEDFEYKQFGISKLEAAVVHYSNPDDTPNPYDPSSDPDSDPD